MIVYLKNFPNICLSWFSSNNAATAIATKKKKTNTKQPNANQKQPTKRGRKPYERDEHGNMIRPNKENQTSVQKNSNNFK